MRKESEWGSEKKVEKSGCDVTGHERDKTTQCPKERYGERERRGERGNDG